MDVSERLPVVVADGEQASISSTVHGGGKRCSGCTVKTKTGLSCSLAAALERIRCAYCGFGVADGVGAVPVGAASFFFFFFFGGCMAGC
jgi:hypothetical protein